MLEPLGVALHAIRLRETGRANESASSAAGRSGCSSSSSRARRAPPRSSPRTCCRIGWRPPREAGATSTALVAGGSERAELRAATGGHGVDIAFEAAGVDDSVETSVSLAAPGGTVVIVGIPSEDHTTFTASTGSPQGPHDQTLAPHEPCLPGGHPARRGGVGRRSIDRDGQLPAERTQSRLRRRRRSRGIEGRHQPLRAAVGVAAARLRSICCAHSPGQFAGKPARH